MNTQLRDFAVQTIKDGLSQLPPAWVEKFKLMYGRNNGKRLVETAVGMPIDEILAEIPDEKLDWAMTQVENSLKKLSKEPK